MLTDSGDSQGPWCCDDACAQSYFQGAFVCIPNSIESVASDTHRFSAGLDWVPCLPCSIEALLNKVADRFMAVFTATAGEQVQGIDS